MASITFKTASFEIKLPVVQIEWGVSGKDMWLKLYGVEFHEREVIKQIFKNKIPSLWGTNDPSCCYAVDVIINEMAPMGHPTGYEFRRFSWVVLEDEDNWLRCEGFYREDCGKPR